MKPLLIIGASSFGLLVHVLAEDAGREVLGFIDDSNSGKDVLGRTDELGTRFLPADVDLSMAIGYKHLDARIAMFRRLVVSGFHFPALAHPAARISRRASLGAGCLVMASADVDSFTRVGEACVIWPQVAVSHDNNIGDNTFIGPAATLCGFVSVGESSFIGANSTIIEGSVLPPGSFVKAATRHDSRVRET